MKIQILIIKNPFSYPITDALQKYKDWLISLELEPEVEIKDGDLKLKFESEVRKPYWAIEALNYRLMELGIVQLFKYDIVVFLYSWRQAGFQWAENKQLAAKTHYDDLSGSALIQIPLQAEWVYDLFRMIRHETLHAFLRILDWKGINIPDRLDETYTAENEEKHLQLIKPYFKQLLKDYSILQKISILQRLINFLKVMLGIKQKEEKEKLRKLARSIALEFGLDADVFVATIECESRFNPRAKNVNKNGTIDWGICQFNSYWYRDLITPEQAVNNPELAMRLMASQWKKGRAKDWLCYKNAIYIKYLKV